MYEMYKNKTVFLSAILDFGGHLELPKDANLASSGFQIRISILTYLCKNIFYLYRRYCMVIFGSCRTISCIFHCKPMADNDAPRAGPVWTPGPHLAGFIKRTTIHCYTQNISALGLVVSEKKIFLCFSQDAPASGPIWTQGAQLAGFIKRTTIHCYT